MTIHRRHIRFLACLTAVVALSALPRAAFAHGAGEEGPHQWSEALHTWDIEPGSLIGLLVSATIYLIGLFRAWRTSGVGHGILTREACCFGAGWLVLAFALLSPLHPLGETLFSAHMVQHEVLMLVAAPLIVLGRPIIALLRALPDSAAHRLGWLSNRPAWKVPWAVITGPLFAWVFHAAVLWGWHAPELFQSTLTSEWAHAAQHVSFLLAATLFWWSILQARHGGSSHDGASVLSLFTTAIHSGLLGALLTFSRTPWYPAYDDTESWGLTPLEDQQLGGLVMWIPACTVYIAAGLYLFAKWVGRSDRNTNAGFGFAKSSRLAPAGAAAEERSAP